jgi:hypothetical protein
MNTGGQTPGVPALLEKHLRDAEVSLWPANARHSVNREGATLVSKTAIHGRGGGMKGRFCWGEQAHTAFLKEEAGSAGEPEAFSAPLREGSSHLELAPVF